MIQTALSANKKRDLVRLDEPSDGEIVAIVGVRTIGWGVSVNATDGVELGKTSAGRRVGVFSKVGLPVLLQAVVDRSRIVRRIPIQIVLFILQIITMTGRYYQSLS
jgi:hypothetical protein